MRARRAPERGHAAVVGHEGIGGAEPRAAQFENVAIQIFAPQYAPFIPLGFDYRAETHAYFPHAHFDEVVKDGMWTFGRKDEGYIALWSLNFTGWRQNQPEVYENAGLDFDLAAPFQGAQNVWIMELSSLSESGSFESFREAILAASITTTPLGDQDGNGFDDGFDVEYESPSQGRITFGWYAPLVVNGVEVPLHDYPRFDNPFVRTEFDDTRYEVSDGEYELLLDFATNERRVSAPKREKDGHGPPECDEGDGEVTGDDRARWRGLKSFHRRWISELRDGGSEQCHPRKRHRWRSRH